MITQRSLKVPDKKIVKPVVGGVGGFLLGGPVGAIAGLSAGGSMAAGRCSRGDGWGAAESGKEPIATSRAD